MVTISINDITVPESVGNAQFTVTLSGVSNKKVYVNYKAFNGSATAGKDFYYKAGKLTFFPGELYKTISIPIVADKLAEPLENLRVELSWPVNATISKGVGVCSIIDDDSAPIVFNWDSTVITGKGNSIVQLTGSLSRPSSMPISVKTLMVDGTALAGKNYNKVDQTFVIQPGETKLTLPIQLLNAEESNVEFVVSAAQADCKLGIYRVSVVIEGQPKPINDYVEIYPVENTGIVPNPGIGYQTFYCSSRQDPNTKSGQLFSNVYYTRVEWSSIEKTLGVYDWGVIDRELENAKSTGQKFCFRVMPFEEGDSGPVCYRNAGLPGFSFVVAGVNSWIPNYNDKAVQTAMSNFIRAMGERYGNNPNIDSVDIGMVGRWGEMHYYECQPQPPLPTIDTWRWLIYTFLTSFKCQLFINPEPALDNPDAFKYAISNGIGWRDDGWNDPWGVKIAIPQVWRVAGDSWKTAPIYLEPMGTFKDTPEWRKSLQWAADNHASQFSNKSETIPPTLMPAVKEMVGKMGYKLVLERGKYPNSISKTDNVVTLTLDWVNKGNAPPYKDCYVLIKVGETVFVCDNLRGMLPGLRTTLCEISTSALPYGLLPVRISLGSTQNKPDITIACQGLVDNWLPLGVLNVV